MDRPGPSVARRGGWAPFVGIGRIVSGSAVLGLLDSYESEGDEREQRETLAVLPEAPDGVASGH
jgi:hypothetical protein